MPIPALATGEDEKGPSTDDFFRLSHEKERRGRFLILGTLEALLRSGAFAVTAELNPPRSADGGLMRKRAAALKGHVDAANVTDSARARVSMSALAAAVLVSREGLEPIVQMTGRDRNRIALQADLLGISALELPNVLLMSGDDPAHGDHPEAVNVKDLDGLGLLRAAVGMRDGHKFLSGGAIAAPPRFFAGATASPYAQPMQSDVVKTLDKVAAGADFLQTQPVFDLDTFMTWLSAVRGGGASKVAVLAGVLILSSSEQAERLSRVPGVAVSAAVVERMRSSADQAAEGATIAAETIAALRASGQVQGVHLYAVDRPEAIVRTVALAGLSPRSAPAG